MSSFFKNLFTSRPAGKIFRFVIIDPGDAAPMNQWYRMSHWQSQNFLLMKTEWDKNWKLFSQGQREPEEPVVGVTYNNRQRKFLIMGDCPDFKVFLERDAKNPKDRNAIKIMGSATVDGTQTIEQLGFLSKKTAELLKDEAELDARPRSVYLPYGDTKFGLRILVLVRSQAYKKKTLTS